MIISTLTDIPGSSAMVDRGFVTYSNDAKIEMLGVSAVTLDAHGAVSRETAIEMASRCACALACRHRDFGHGHRRPRWRFAGKAGRASSGSGWRGPAGAAHAERHVFENRGRDFIRRETVKTALRIGLETLEREG